MGNKTSSTNNDNNNNNLKGLSPQEVLEVNQSISIIVKKKNNEQRTIVGSKQ